MTAHDPANTCKGRRTPRGVEWARPTGAPAEALRAATTAKDPRRDGAGAALHLMRLSARTRANANTSAESLPHYSTQGYADPNDGAFLPHSCPAFLTSDDNHSDTDVGDDTTNVVAAGVQSPTASSDTSHIGRSQTRDHRAPQIPSLLGEKRLRKSSDPQRSLKRPAQVTPARHANTPQDHALLTSEDNSRMSLVLGLELADILADVLEPQTPRTVVCHPDRQRSRKQSAPLRSLPSKS